MNVNNIHNFKDNLKTIPEKQEYNSNLSVSED